jgi:hypothetical protein
MSTFIWSVFNGITKLWPRTWVGQHRMNIALAWSWFFVGIYGLLEYLSWIPHNPLLADKIANSIPILFAISVYANFVGHLSTAEASKPESESMTKEEEDDQQA